MGRGAQAGFSIGNRVTGLIGVQNYAGMGYHNGNVNQDENGAGGDGGQQHVFGGVSGNGRRFGFLERFGGK